MFTASRGGVNAQSVGPIGTEWACWPITADSATQGRGGALKGHVQGLFYRLSALHLFYLIYVAVFCIVIKVEYKRAWCTEWVLCSWISFLADGRGGAEGNYSALQRSGASKDCRTEGCYCVGISDQLFSFVLTVRAHALTHIKNIDYINVCVKRHIFNIFRSSWMDSFNFFFIIGVKYYLSVYII